MDRTFFITSVTAQRRTVFQRTIAADLLGDVFLAYRGQGNYLLHELVIMPGPLPRVDYSCTHLRYRSSVQCDSSREDFHFD
jgi:putative transposase